MRIIFYILTLSLLGCSQSSNQTFKKSETINIDSKTDSIKAIIQANNKDYPTQKNLKDIKGLKQGVWDYHEKGQLKGFETYSNDTLNGLSRVWINYPEQIVEGNYKNGKKDGLWKHYYDSKNLLSVSEYKNDTIIWTGFPSVDSEFHTPIKGFHIFLDSVYVNCPHINGVNWYKGLFINRKPIGIHYMFYPNGKRKFEHDYNIKIIRVYDTSGKLEEEKKDNIDKH